MYDTVLDFDFICDFIFDLFCGHVLFDFYFDLFVGFPGNNQFMGAGWDPGFQPKGPLEEPLKGPHRGP